MSANVLTNLVKPVPVMRRVIIYATLLPVVFLLGFIPTWLNSRECSRGLSEAVHQLNLARIQNSLGSAAIYARRGGYEPARQAASDFFTSLRAEADKGDDSALSLAQRDGVQALVTQRDGIITLLARSDPASADRLSDLYGSYLKLMNR